MNDLDTPYMDETGRVLRDGRPITYDVNGRPVTTVNDGREVWPTAPVSPPPVPTVPVAPPVTLQTSGNLAPTNKNALLLAGIVAASVVLLLTVSR